MGLLIEIHKVFEPNFITVCGPFVSHDYGRVRVFVIAVAGIGSRGGDPPIVAFTVLEIEQGISTEVRYGSRGGDLPIVAFTTLEIGLGGSTEVRSGGRNGFVRCGKRERERESERMREGENAKREKKCVG